MPWKYNGQVVNTTKGFRNSDGYMSPKNWNVAWDDDTKKQREWYGKTNQTIPFLLHKN